MSNSTVINGVYSNSDTTCQDLSGLLSINTGVVNFINLDFRLFIDELIAIGAVPTGASSSMGSRIMCLVRESLGSKMLSSVSSSAEIVYAIQEHVFGFLKNTSHGSYLSIAYHYSIPIFIRDLGLMSLADKSRAPLSVKDHVYTDYLFDNYEIYSYLFLNNDRNSRGFILCEPFIDIGSESKILTGGEVDYLYDILF